MVKRRVHSCIAVIAILAAPLAACSDAGDVPAVGPADAYVDLVLGVSTEVAERQVMRREETLAACMAEAGFEYVPTLANTVFIDEDAVDPPRDSREFAEQYGYGLASRPPEVTSPSVADPNADIMAAMSEAELEEYYLARDGTNFQDYVAAGAPEDWVDDWTRGGCAGRAWHEADELAPDKDAVYLALKAEIDRIDAEVVPAHPDVVAADSAWSECMADAGFPGYVRQPEAEDRERALSEAPDVATGAIGADGLTDGQREAFPHERAVATADWDCVDEVGYAEVVARVRAGAQQEYVDAHRDELDAWVERYADAEQATP